LKDFIFNMIKDEDEKRIIRGGWDNLVKNVAKDLEQSLATLYRVDFNLI
jgi:hypothetical protein